MYDLSWKIIYLKPQIEIDCNVIFGNGIQFQQSQQYNFKSVRKFQHIQQLAE